MKKEKLINICTPRQWKTLSTSELMDKGYPVYGANGIIGYYDSYNHESETVMVTCRGATCGMVNLSEPFSYINGNAMCMDDVRDDVDTRYLYYALKQYDFKNIISGSAQPQITRQGLSKVYISITNKEKQLEIVESLSKVEQLLDNKKLLLLEYDQLIKSRFIEMFGDIFTNEKSFKVGLFEDYVEQMNIGPFGSALKNEYFVSKEDSYCMVYEQKHAIRKDIDIDRRYVTFDKYKELQRFEIGPGDLIVSCRGTIGECHLLPKNAPMGIIHPSLMMIKPKKHVNGRFLLYLLEKILERQLDSGSGVKMAIQAKELAKVKTIIPEKNIQDDYVFFVEQVDKLKFEVLKLLRELR